MLSRDEISDITWKWRCKLSNIGVKTEKTLADYSSDDTSLKGKVKNAALSDEKPSKDPGFGSTPSVKTFFEGRDSNENCIDWVDYPPKQMSKSAARAQDRVAIKAYKVKDKEKPVMSGRFALKYHMIEIQNPLLVAALDEILKKEDVHLDINETASFEEPFRPLFFCYDDIVAKYKSLADDNPLRQYILLLVKVLDEIFGETRAKLYHLRESGLVSFKLAWTYFPKGSVVLSWGNNCELLCKVVDTIYKKVSPIDTIMVVRGKVMRFNGEAFQWEDYELELPAFNGNKPVTDLPHYPLEFHKDADQVRARLAERGRKVLDHQGLSYCTYTGIGIYQEGKKLEKHNVDGRVLIDVVGYNKHHLAQGTREGKDPETLKKTVRGTGRKQGALGTVASNAVSGKRLGEEEQQKNKDAMLAKPEDLMFMSPLLEGYALKNKIWVSFYVEDIRPMVWNDKAYDHLVYDEQQKDLVLSFVESHGHAKPQMEDVIVGKGQGLIILLSGPPGTGKTLTAEAVADRTHRPLFYLQAEDLGINAATLGANIKKVFEMATEWDAVILLDEADVFMAERHPHDIARNELVSIFLRELEYYRGIIFLTTNLYSTIDSAFRSRVSLHLLFKPLTAEARGVVWRKFLDRLPAAATALKQKKALTNGAETEGGGEANGEAEKAEKETDELTDDDLKELSAWQLNGREIKNAVKMVKSWCDHKGYDMTLSRLENGIKVTSPHASKYSHENDDAIYES